MYGVPKATLKRRFDDKNLRAKGEKQIIGSTGDLTPDLEKKLVEHILELERCLYGITPTDVRNLAFKIAEQNGLNHRFNKEKETAGKKWYYGFLKRHPELSLRQPRATSFNRATAFNKPAVKDFFEKLENIMDKHDINDPRRIFNVDETGLTTEQRKPRKILAQKGKHQVGAITSGERGTTTTVVCCASAAGYFIPPLIIFKRKRPKDELRDGAPPGTIFAFNPDSGYINKEIFFVWMQHFVESVKPTPEKKVPLILDGHTSYTKNLDAINYAKNHNVVLLSLPAHTSNKLQPLDTSFFRPLSSYFIDETEKWLRCNPGRCVTVFQISMLFGKAYARAASVGTAASGFEKSGIWPLNKDIFQDYEFITLAENDDPLQDNENMPNMDIDPLPVTSSTQRNVPTPQTAGLNIQQCVSPIEIQNEPVVHTLSESHFQRNLQTVSSDMQSDLVVTSHSESELIEQVPRTISKEQHADESSGPNTIVQSLRQPTPSTSSDFHIASISPGAKKVIEELRSRSRKPQRALELTSSPYKRELEAAKSKTKSKPPPKKAKKTVEKAKKTVEKVNDEEVEQWFCKIYLLCSVEDMIQCLACKCWVHEECACVKKAAKKYFCPSCR
ncbi:hypothetical protein O0L34_g17502 [Tuta absoluta]|nr:hypothetical protein O0L34_g17502 [Tuta absoluta]